MRKRCDITAVKPGPSESSSKGPDRAIAIRTFAARSRSPLRSGFTLIEAMLAGVLLALIGAAVGGAVTQSLRTAIVSRDTQRAAALLDETMTRIDLIGPARLAQEGPTSGTFAPPDDRFQWNADIETLAEPDLYQVTLTVTWMGTDGQRSAQVVTRLYDPAGSRDAYLQWEALGE